MLRNYLTTAFRNLRRNPGYTAINVGGLAVGIVVCLLIVLYVHYELGYDRFHDNADRIYRLIQKDTSGAFGEEVRHLSHLQGPMGPTLTFDGEEERVVTGIVDDVPRNSHLTFDFLTPMPKTIFGMVLDAYFGLNLSREEIGRPPAAYMRVAGRGIGLVEADQRAQHRSGS